MLLANVEAAKLIYNHNPNISLLRKHMSPKILEIEKLRSLFS